MQKRCTRKEQAWLREEKWTDKNTKYIFFPLSLFNILSSFSYILIYNSYYPRYSTILFSLFNYNFIYLRLFLFSPSLFLLILNFSLSIFYLYPSLLFSALLFFHHSFISRFPILHLPSYSSYSFLQFPTAPPISSNPPYHSSFSFFRHSFPLFTTSSFQSSNSNLPSSHLISTLPRPLFLANHFSLLSVHSLSLIPLLTSSPSWRKTQQPMPPRRWIMDFERSHASYLPPGWIFIMRFYAAYDTRSCTSSRVPRDEHALAKRDAGSGPATSESERIGKPIGVVERRGSWTRLQRFSRGLHSTVAVWPVSNMKSFGRKTTRGSRPSRFTVWIWSHLATRLVVVRVPRGSCLIKRGMIVSLIDILVHRVLGGLIFWIEFRSILEEEFYLRLKF